MVSPITLFCFMKTYAEALNFVLLIKSALLINVNFHYINYFSLNKGANDLFYTHFIVPIISAKYRHINKLTI